MKRDRRIGEIVTYLKDPLCRNSIFIMATQALIAGLGMLFWVLAARLYVPEEVGFASALLSAVILLHSFSRLGFDIGLVRFLPAEENKQDMINTCLTLAGLFSMLLAAIFVLGLGVWSPKLIFVQQEARYFALFVVLTGLFTLTMLQGNVFIAFRATQLGLLQHGVGALRLVPLAFMISLGVFGILSSWGIALFLVFGCAIALTMRVCPRYRPIPTVRRAVVGKILRFSAGNYVGESFRELPGFLMPLIIIAVLEPAMSAYFYVSWTIVGAMFMIPYGTSFALLAEGSYRPQDLRAIVAKALKLTYALLVPAIVILFVLAGLVLSLFGREYSENAASLLRMLCVSGLPLGLNAVYIAVRRVRGQITPIILIYGFIAATTLGVGYLLMNREGLVGIGIAWILAQAAVSLFVGLAMVKEFYRR